MAADHAVLDLGFWGQGQKITSEHWPHRIIKKLTTNVYGVDIEYDQSQLDHPDHYVKASAEDFDFDVSFDIIFAGDLIEHLSNPGLMLDACARNIKDDGVLMITTPNAFSLFTLAGKFSNSEDPMVNSDHTCYFNHKTLKKLLEKNNWEVVEQAYLYTLESAYKESLKKKFLNMLYYLFSKWTSKYIETMVVIAKKKS